MKRDWQNAYADFVANLKGELRKIEDEVRRREALALMRDVLDRFAEHKRKRPT